jgi:thioredoxin-like negative regulator of GroEL
MKTLMNQSLLEESIKDAKALLVYFYSDQCAPCISLRPKVEQLLKEDYPEMKLQLINSQSYPEITASFSVFAFTTLILFFEGREQQRFSKYVSIQQLHETIGRPYSLIFDTEP